MARQVLWTIKQTEALLIPNKWDTVLYSAVVDKHKRVTATRFSMLIEALMLVVSGSTSSLN